MSAHLRVTLRQPATALNGRKYVPHNDSVEVIADGSGEVLADLTSFVSRIEIIDDVNHPRVLRLDMYAGEIQSETEPPGQVAIGDA